MVKHKALERFMVFFGQKLPSERHSKKVNAAGVEHSNWGAGTQFSRKKLRSPSRIQMHYTGHHASQLIHLSQLSQ